MHKLSRQVRFSIAPFDSDVKEGFNSYCSKPGTEQLGFYFGLWVQLTADVDEDTGFVVNVGDIDKAVRGYAVPVFAEQIQGYFAQGKAVGFKDVCRILKEVWEVLDDKFGSVRLSKICLELNPFRKVTIEREDLKVVYFHEKFEFAALHTLWNDEFTDDRNLEVFGKCANPAGHGHNYIIEITIKKDAAAEWSMAEFERVVDSEFIALVDHKNLNVDVERLRDDNPTVENIASFAWECLRGKFGGAQLCNVTVWENDRTCCSYRE
jgi:6-pyruvoyltetrahydropterin/6-carboxytetrahydropterin synthase